MGSMLMKALQFMQTIIHIAQNYNPCPFKAEAHDLVSLPLHI